MSAAVIRGQPQCVIALGTNLHFFLQKREFFSIKKNRTITHRAPLLACVCACAGAVAFTLLLPFVSCPLRTASATPSAKKSGSLATPCLTGCRWPGLSPRHILRARRHPAPTAGLYFLRPGGFEYLDSSRSRPFLLFLLALSLHDVLTRFSGLTQVC